MVALGAAPLLSGCGGSPAGPRRSCRTYATGLTRNGTAGTCRFDGRTYGCHFGLDERTWEYAGVSDFVEEARTPNRLLARRRRSSGGGPMLISSGGHETSYTYDGARRFLRRERRGWNSFGTWDIDSTTYDAWDGLGRPIAGEIVTAGGSAPLSVEYDDTSLTATASNGELAVRDDHRNIVREVEFGGSPAQVYVVTATAEVCE
jgi:YD repeat-containing protein